MPRTTSIDGRPMTVPAERSARIAWFEELGSQSPRDAGAPAVSLPPPRHVTATGGRGQVTVAWEPVPGAAGYVVQRADREDGELVPIDNHGGDVLAVPHGPYVDTTLGLGDTG